MKLFLWVFICVYIDPKLFPGLGISYLYKTDLRECRLRKQIYRCVKEEASWEETDPEKKDPAQESFDV